MNLLHALGRKYCARRLTGKVDRKEVNDELGNLHGGEVLLPLETQSAMSHTRGRSTTYPDLASTGSGPVVVVYAS